MDTSDSPLNSDDRKTKNVMWSEEMDKVLIDALVMQANEGNKVDKGFKESAYVYAANGLNSQFNLSLRKDKILNRLKTLKKKYVALCAVLGTSGFSFNHVSGRIDCADEDVWTTYIQEHPEASSLRDKPTKMFSEMCIVFGNDNATGQWASGPKDLRAKKSSNAEKDNLETSAEEQEEFVEYFEAEKNPSMPSSSVSLKRREKRMKEANKRMKEGEIYKKSIQDIASNMGRIADAIQNNMKFVDASKIIEAVRSVGGLTEDAADFAIEWLVANQDKARLFIAYDVHARQRFLCRYVFNQG